MSASVTMNSVVAIRPRPVREGGEAPSRCVSHWPCGHALLGHFRECYRETGPTSRTWSVALCAVANAQVDWWGNDRAAVADVFVWDCQRQALPRRSPARGRAPPGGGERLT